MGSTARSWQLEAAGIAILSGTMASVKQCPSGHWFILAFAFSGVLGSVYGFLQGAWPFGVLEAVWAVVAAKRWQNVS
jgi:hypothetical protein